VNPQGVFYGVGVGPGDPELLTLKAVRVLQGIDAVAVPRAGAEKESLAYAIAREFIPVQARVLELVFPMTRETRRLEQGWKEAAARIQALLEQGKNTAFLTVGDPMLYSTYIYIFQRIQEAGYSVETVPGIPSFCAAAAAAGFPLAEGDDRLALVPWNREQALQGEALQPFSSLALLKVSSDLEGIIETLAETGFLQRSMLVSRCGHEDERIVTDLASLKGSAVPYFSLILARKETP